MRLCGCFRRWIKASWVFSGPIKKEPTEGSALWDGSRFARGLGIRNLQLQGLAMRVRCEWLRRTDTTRPWQGLSLSIDDKAREVFDSLVRIEVGDGKKILFCRD
jgi:hypothetical protein